MVKQKTGIAPEQSPKKPGKTDYSVPAEVFIATWQTSDSAIEVAEKLKMPKDIVHARASTYRQAGIRLKKMPRHKTKALDVDKLNAIIDEIDRQALREGGTKNSSSAPREGEDGSRKDVS
jgi:hypothetical protein